MSRTVPNRCTECGMVNGHSKACSVSQKQKAERDKQAEMTPENLLRRIAEIESRLAALEQGR